MAASFYQAQVSWIKNLKPKSCIDVEDLITYSLQRGLLRGLILGVDMFLYSIGNASAAMLGCWLLFLLGTIGAYLKKSWMLPFLFFTSAVSMACAFALLVPFLYPWDEQFHALVGKNLTGDFFVPRLVPHHPVAASQDNWVNSVIWLHKQPLFTWQMALSVKLFGANAFAIRLPSAVFHGIMTVTVFRIGTLVFNRKTGFIAALMLMHSGFLLGLISGRTATDHNDYIFLSYVTLSFWAWFEWDVSGKRKWLYWIGIFAGCAILTKWLVGLIVFAGWGLVVLPKLRKHNFWSLVKPILISLGIAMLVSLPWQIYTFIRFPAVAQREMEYNALHITEAVENHPGDRWFHYDQLSTLYFDRIDFLLLFVAGCVLFIAARNVKKAHKIFILVTIGVIYAFFTLVKTKMPAFTLPAMALTVLLVAFAITQLARIVPYRRSNRVASFLLAALVACWMLKPAKTIEFQGVYEDKSKPFGVGLWYKAHAFAKAHGPGSRKRVVFGVNFFDYAHISWMFFNNDLAYPFLPTASQVTQLQHKGYSVTIIESEGNVLDKASGVEGVEMLRWN